MALDLVDTGIVNSLSIQTCPDGFFSDPVGETYQNARKFGSWWKMDGKKGLDRWMEAKEKKREEREDQYHKFDWFGGKYEPLIWI